MSNVTPYLVGCTTLLALGLSIAPAQALNTRSFVSANGNDANNCGRATPCRSLQVAHDKTNAGGEINMLDPAGYGTVTITKAISIVNDGVGSAGVLVPPGGTGITVNAGPNDRINLRGLIIEGAGTGSIGIVLISGKSLMIGKCIIRNLVSSGIAIAPIGFSDIVVTDTVVADNGGHGIYIQPPGGVVRLVSAVFNRVEVYNNTQDGIGLYANLMSADSQIYVNLENTVAARNNEVGFRALTTAGQGEIVVVAAHAAASLNLQGDFFAQGPFSRMNVMHSHTSGLYGYKADDSALIILNDSSAEGLWSITNGAKIFTLGNNTLRGGDGSLTPGLFY